MGSAACRLKVKQHDQSIQMPSVSPCRSTSTPPSGQPYSTVIPWPNPAEKGFKVQSNTEQYTSVWDQNTKVGVEWKNLENLHDNILVIIDIFSIIEIPIQ